MREADAVKARAAARADYTAARKSDPAGTRTRVHRAHRTVRTADRAVKRARRRTPDRLEVMACKVAVGVTGAAFAAGPDAMVAAVPWVELGGGSAVVVWICSAAWRAAREGKRQSLTPTTEETELLGRLATSYWTASTGTGVDGKALPSKAAERGLEGLVPGRARLTDGGIVCALRMDGTWKLGKVKAAEEHIRALLGARTGLHIQFQHGTRGGWARMTLRTRSAVDGADMRWRPGCSGVGLDTVTGEAVAPTPYAFRLVAGATGMGKSVFLRPWIAQAMANPRGAVVLIDPKHQEYKVWQGKFRIEHHKAQIYALMCDLEVEMERRQNASTGSTWIATEADPEILVIVEEGASLVRWSKDRRYADILDKAEALATMGRAVRIWLLWATQYPSKEKSVPAQVVEMMLDKVALTVDSAQADRLIFGEKAAESGWEPSKLPGIPGVALVRNRARDREPTPVKGWYMDDDTARSLPPGITWHLRRPADAPKDPDELAVGQQVGAVPAQTNRDRVLAAVLAGATANKEIAQLTGLNKGTVSTLIKGLVASGRLVRAEDARVQAAGPREAPV
ncbi:hypothetical protein ABZ543_08300 [Streptomyces roseifaciens]